MSESTDSNEVVNFLRPSSNGKVAESANNMSSPPQKQISTASATGNPRNKVALKPGRSLLDWIRLGHSSKDLTGVKGRILQVTPEELMQHNQRHDAWTCLRGKIYNITAYMEFHPGGEDELMRAAGKDATELFNEVHNWVNAESMLQKCFVGYLNVTPLSIITNPIMNMIRPHNENTSAAVAKAINPPLPPEVLAKPKFTWSQSSCSVRLHITVPAFLSRESVIAFCRGQQLTTMVHFNDFIYYIDIDLEQSMEDDMKVSVTNRSTAISIVEIELQMKSSDPQCSTLGTFLRLHDQVISRENRELQYVKCILIEKRVVTHDTLIFTLRLPAGSHMIVPVGHHVHLRREIDGIVVVRSYTPVPPNLLHGVHSDTNILHLMIKIYKCGIFTSLLENMGIGDTIDVSDYDGNYNMELFKSSMYIVLLAAGTGLTPMCGVILKTLKSKTRIVNLIFFNKKQQDILWKDQLDILSEENESFTVHYVLSEPDSGWSGNVGRVHADILEPLIPNTSSSDLHVCVCGPQEFTETSLKILHDLGIAAMQIHAFTS